MKRFIKVYLTVLILSFLTINLVLILMYGGRFFLSASGGAVFIGQDLTWPLVIVNGVVLLFFTALWLIARYFYRVSRPKDFL